MNKITAFLTQIVLPAACVVGIAYNLLVTQNGEEGRRAAALLREQVAVETQALEAAKLRTARLSDRADRLLVASLDRDLLEERVRARLGLVSAEEYMVRMGDVDRLAGLEAEHGPGSRYAELQH
ncbi:FtsB family cell division protein [Parvularcula oceani]|uniref:FtsB family cell division protein n=1 Tax=Parvularcula oceani TaxID=1247963 RepID=UPI0004E0D496|nr:septum formation initiator family protein [Parvularcula oceani]